MNSSFLLLFANLTSITCVVSAAYLAYNDVWGWGWFLIVAFFLSLRTVEKLDH